MALIVGIGVEGEDEEDLPLPILDDPEQSRRMAGYWKEQIIQSDEANEIWHRKGREILDRYRDQRGKKAVTGEEKRLNVLWSNVQIMRPALYGQRPEPIIERRFLDRDPIGRVSATMLERVVREQMDEYGFHYAMKRAVNDMLLPGRGQLWVRYEPEFGESLSIPVASRADIEDAQGLIEDPDETDTPEEQKLEDTSEEVVAESCQIDYVPWRDFYIFPVHARTWKEVQAIGKRVSITKQGCIDRFGEDIGKKVQADPQEKHEHKLTDESLAETHDFNERNRTVYEIWCKSDRTVYWVSTGYHALLDAREDPLELRGFFPAPEPLSATLTNDSLTPVPDYIEYQDQAIQIDELTQRISMLSKSIKAAGTYDASNRSLQRLLQEDTENQLIPVDNWAQFSQKGGLEGGIFMLPIDQQIKALQILVEVRTGILQDIDRITGISDILRGTTDARETLGAQRLKTNNAGTRLDERRSDVARFARDVVRLIAEIVAKHFTEKTLIEASGILYEDEFQPKQPPLPPPGGPMQGPQPGSMPMNGAMPPPPSGPLPSPGPQPGPMPAGGGANLPMVRPPAPPVAGPGQTMTPMGQPVPLQPQPNPMGMFASLLPAVQKIQKAIDLLRKDVMRGYRIDIETDSMVAGDIEQERQDATEFLTAVTQFVTSVGPIVMQQPDFMPIAGKLLQFGVRKFRTGRDLEAAIDEYVDTLLKKAQASEGAPQQPDPQMVLAQTKMQAEHMKAQAEMGRAQMDMQAQQANDQRQAQIDAQRHEMDMAKMQQEAAMQREEHGMRMQELAARLLEHQQKTGVAPPEGTLAKQQKDHLALMAHAADKIHAAAVLHHKAATTPRKIVRGPDGRAIGVAPGMIQ